MLLLFAFKIFQAIAADMGLIQTGEVWQFRTEADLEELAWHHLPELLRLKPLSRQFSIGGKFCDILAVEPSQRLIVIELKNTEDRYSAHLWAIAPLPALSLNSSASVSTI